MRDKEGKSENTVKERGIKPEAINQEEPCSREQEEGGLGSFGQEDV